MLEDEEEVELLDEDNFLPLTFEGRGEWREENSTGVPSTPEIQPADRRTESKKQKKQK